MMKNRILNFVTKKLDHTNGKPLLKLFLLGVKGQLQAVYQKPYNYYLVIFGGLMSFALVKWLTDLKKAQMQWKGYNWFVPDYVYKVREESHCYWELARIANNLPTTFTYYKWDSGVMYEVNREGKQTPFQSHTSIEDPNAFGSFLHEYNFPASPQKHAQIMMYLKNINNPYDLNNYLRSKSINIGDWLRTLYYLIYRELGLTNRWRYDQFVAKPDIYYRWEKMKLAYRITKNRQKLYETIDKMQIDKQDVIKFFIWFA